MNWLLIVILVIFLIFVIRGWRRGLLKMLFSVISIVILIALVAWATPHISTLIRENTGIYTMIENRCTEAIQSRVESGLESGVSQSSDSIGVSLPETITAYIVGGGENALAESGVYETAGSNAADWILSGAAFLIAVILAIIIVKLIGHALGIVNHIPIIGGINRVLGLFAGGFEAFVVVSLLFLFTALIAGTESGNMITACIDESEFLSYWYDHNVLLQLGLLS
ncbi:MAG: CvpA family protein [Lachnospiraceae bacterium]|nr:CvpA family protein [Lachnospiraceae bacterium]